jgi:hypothetical protein
MMWKLLLYLNQKWIGLINERLYSQKLNLFDEYSDCPYNNITAQISKSAYGNMAIKSFQEKTNKN